MHTVTTDLDQIFSRTDFESILNSFRKEMTVHFYIFMIEQTVERW